MSGSSALSDAMITYIGIGDGGPAPKWDPERMLERYGGLLSADLLPHLERLADEFYSVKPQLHEDSVATAARAAHEFATRHPELSADAVEALEHAYAYDTR
jgi:hypothetical protein